MDRLPGLALGVEHITSRLINRVEVDAGEAVLSGDLDRPAHVPPQLLQGVGVGGIAHEPRVGEVQRSSGHPDLARDLQVPAEELLIPVHPLGAPDHRRGDDAVLVHVPQLRAELLLALALVADGSRVRGVELAPVVQAIGEALLEIVVGPGGRERERQDAHPQGHRSEDLLARREHDLSRVLASLGRLRDLDRDPDLLVLTLRQVGRQQRRAVLDRELLQRVPIPPRHHRRVINGHVLGPIRERELQVVALVLVVHLDQRIVMQEQLGNQRLLASLHSDSVRGISALVPALDPFDVYVLRRDLPLRAFEVAGRQQDLRQVLRGPEDETRGLVFPRTGGQLHLACDLALQIRGVRQHHARGDCLRAIDRDLGRSHVAAFERHGHVYEPADLRGQGANRLSMLRARRPGR